MPMRNHRERALPSPTFRSALPSQPGRRSFLKGMLISGGAALALGLGACTDGKMRLQVTGASTHTPPTEDIARLFNAAKPELRFEVTSGGTGQGLRALHRHDADIAMVARKLSDAERQGLKVQVVASDGIAIVANEDAPLPGDLSKSEARALFSGAVLKTGLVIFQKSEGHGTRQAFAEGLGLTSAELYADAEAGSNGQMLQSVSRTPGAVGYVSHVDAEAAVKAGLNLRIIRLEGHPPTRQTVADGRYPIIRQLAYAFPEVSTSMATEGAGRAELRRRMATQAFVEFALGPEGRKVFSEHGFAPVSED